VDAHPARFADLPVSPPISPMLAKAVADIPVDAGWSFEPKWDGFRTIIFRSGDDVELGSRNEKPLTRYFPEVVAAVKRVLPERCVVDAEMVVIGDDGRIAFDTLQQRIHPAASRVKMLSETCPAVVVVFDVLAIGDDDLRAYGYGERRARLEALDAPWDEHVRLTPTTTDTAVARRWFVEFEGAGCDGLIAKHVDVAYQPDKRVMLKIKHKRTADCVVAGYRLHKNGVGVGSLLLGLYGDDGRLHHVGVTSSFTDVKRRALIDELAPLVADDLSQHPWGSWIEAEQEAAAQGQRVPGAQSRWSGGKDLSFVPLRPERVCEIAYAHMQGDRIRHTGTFVRWRPDRDPASCGYGQLEQPADSLFADVFAG
jgi:ATP-dependent DNA ligase